MADSHLPPTDDAVNDPSHPAKTDTGLLQAVLHGCYAALLVEQFGKLTLESISQGPKPRLSAFDAFDSMHHDVYQALHAAITQLATERCKIGYQQIGQLMDAFFGAECRADQITYHGALLDHLATLDASGSGSAPDHAILAALRHLFAELSKTHWLDPGPVS